MSPVALGLNRQPPPGKIGGWLLGHHQRHRGAMLCGLDRIGAVIGPQQLGGATDLDWSHLTRAALCN